MVLRWAAASLLERETYYKRVAGYKQQYRLLAILEDMGKSTGRWKPKA